LDGGEGPGEGLLLHVRDTSLSAGGDHPGEKAAWLDGVRGARISGSQCSRSKAWTSGVVLPLPHLRYESLPQAR
jgi:hypothetical protein